MEKKERNIQMVIVLIVIAAGTAVNMAGSAFAAAVIPKLYLDSLGTIFASALCGYIPGIMVGFITNILKGFSDSSAVYFSILNVLIAVAAARFAKKDMFRKFPHILLTIVTFTLIGGVIGSVLTWFLNGGQPVDGVSFISQLQRDTWHDFLDKTVIVAVACAVFFLLPDKVYQKCNINGWRDEGKDAKFKVAAHSLNTRIIGGVSAATILVGVIVTSISIHEYHESMIDEQAQFASDVTAFAATFIDPDRVDDYITLGERIEGYQETEENLKRIWESSDSIEYMYAYRICEDGCHVVFDLDTDSSEGANPGEVIPFDDSFETYIPALLAGKPIEPLVSDDTYGWLLTVYKPVYDAEGTCQCYMAVDISIPKLVAEERMHIAQMISLFLGFYVLILAIAIWFAKYFLTKPINRMAEAAGEFAYNSETAYEDSVERIRRLNIRTGDEVEHLYHALTKTVEDTAAYITEISEKNQAIGKLQSGLIMVMADLVESRDKCTGDHIKNTAAYVKIIIEQMRKDGIYTDVIDDQFAEDIVLSAPLHDIGKIKVPDAILNKPGKLTDEEFTAMRNHTVYGGKILGDAISQLNAEDSGYLREAQNLALYHHEKWDGSGYPQGLKGEEIPLSARIMAVADVFDALASRRSYKEGMPFEKVISIIQEGAGKHFDPLVVQEFIKAIDEVRKVLNEKTDGKKNEGGDGNEV